MNNCFTQTVSEICGLEAATLITGYKYSVYNGHAVVVEGHKGIAVYNDCNVCFSLKKGKLAVKGSSLFVRCLEKDFAVIVGNIASVAVDNG